MLAGSKVIIVTGGDIIVNVATVIVSVGLFESWPANQCVMMVGGHGHMKRFYKIDPRLML